MSARTHCVASGVTRARQRGAAALAILLLVAGTPLVEGGDDMLAVGETFVDFELPSHDGGTVSSADLAGRPYLLFYYPKADTPG